jgi:hypothetical protein
MIDRRRKTNWMSRRFWQTNAIIMLATALCWFDKLTGELWLAAVLGVAGGYIFANTKEKLAWASSPTPNSSAPPPSSEG